MGPADITVEILKDIRQELRELRDEQRGFREQQQAFNERQLEFNARQQEFNARQQQVVDSSRLRRDVDYTPRHGGPGGGASP